MERDTWIRFVAIHGICENMVLLVQNVVKSGIKMNTIIDLLFILVGTEDNAMKWMFGHNTFFGDSPVNMIAKGEQDKVLGYLEFHVYDGHG